MVLQTTEGVAFVDLTQSSATVAPVFDGQVPDTIPLKAWGSWAWGLDAMIAFPSFVPFTADRTTVAASGGSAVALRGVLPWTNTSVEPSLLFLCSFATPTEVIYTAATVEPVAGQTSGVVDVLCPAPRTNQEPGTTMDVGVLRVVNQPTATWTNTVDAAPQPLLPPPATLSGGIITDVEADLGCTPVGNLRLPTVAVSLRGAFWTASGLE